MPIAKKINKTLADFYDTSETNIYDDYGDDFEADSDKEPSLNGDNEDKATSKKNTQYFDRESTNNTEKSTLFKKRKDQTFGSTVGGYRDTNRTAFSESLTPRQKESGRGTGKGRSMLGSRMKKGTCRICLHYLDLNNYYLIYKHIFDYSTKKRKHSSHIQNM